MARNLMGVFVLGLLLAGIPALAHHSVSAEFDSNKPIEFTGKVVKVEWMNPHIYTHVETTDASGKKMVYHVEGGAPNALFRNGWRPDSLKPGDTVTVKGSRARREDSPRVNGSIMTPAGTRMFAGQAPK